MAVEIQTCPMGETQGVVHIAVVKKEACFISPVEETLCITAPPITLFNVTHKGEEGLYSYHITFNRRTESVQIIRWHAVKECSAIVHTININPNNPLSLDGKIRINLCFSTGDG